MFPDDRYLVHVTFALLGHVLRGGRLGLWEHVTSCFHMDMVFVRCVSLASIPCEQGRIWLESHHNPWASACREPSFSIIVACKYSLVVACGLLHGVGLRSEVPSNERRLLIGQRCASRWVWQDWPLGVWTERREAFHLRNASHSSPVNPMSPTLCEPNVTSPLPMHSPTTSHRSHSLQNIITRDPGRISTQLLQLSSQRERAATAIGEAGLLNRESPCTQQHHVPEPPDVIRVMES